MSDEESSSEHSYVVEKIVGQRMKGNVLQYRVKWQGYDDPSDLTWEPIGHLKNCKESIDSYVRSLKEKEMGKVTKKETTIYEAQSYPYAMINIKNNDKLGMKYDTDIFKFRRYTKGDSDDFKKIKKISKEGDKKYVYYESDNQVEPKKMDIDYMTMLFPKTLSSWATHKISLGN